MSQNEKKNEESIVVDEDTDGKLLITGHARFSRNNFMRETWDFLQKQKCQPISLETSSWTGLDFEIQHEIRLD